jgi:dethiobiotin synthetase
MPYRDENINALRDRITAPLLGMIEPLPKSLQKAVNAPYSLEAIKFAADSIALPNEEFD